MKRIFTLVLVALFVAGQTATAQTIWDGTTDTEWLGSGTQADPYQISTPQELAGLAELVNNKTKDFAGEYICLTADIHLNADTTPDSLKLEWPRIGGWARSEEAFDSTAFCGNFDGRSYTIYGLYYGTMPADTTNWDNPFEDFYVDYSGWERGFFGYLEGATVENLKIHKMTMSGGASMGGLSPYASNSTIRNVHITESAVASSLGSYGGGAGGLVYDLRNCLVESCTVDADVQGTRNVGVLAGIADSATVIRDCSTSGYAYMSQYTCGGFIASNAGLIERCSSSADASRGYYSYAMTSGIPDCAGFVGNNTGIIRDCYATGNIVNTTLQGHAFCGTNTGRLESCYATGNVEGHSPITVSAFCGQNGLYSGYVGDPRTGGEIINCFGTGQCTITDDEEIYTYYRGFIAAVSTPDISMIANGYFDIEKNPLGHNGHGGSFGVTTAYLQSKEFVDTLNMMAALKGLTKWQYNAGGYPTITTEKATNISDYFAGGTGTKDDPYRIETKEHLKNFAKYVNHGYHFAGEYLLQTQDIALNPPFEKWSEEMPELWQTIGWFIETRNDREGFITYTYSFRGTYDGGLHEIQNLYCYSLTTKQGLFGYLGHDAHIRNLGVTDAWVLGSGNSGILAASAYDRYSQNIDIRQCWTSGTIEDKSWAAAGILGDIALEGINYILNCFSNATINSPEYAKPVVGNQNYIGWNDTVGNFLYYGKTEEVYHASAGGEPTRNYFFNKDSVDECAGWSDVLCADRGGYSTAYLHSKEFVNNLNYWVSRWNATHADDPLLYWQYRENDYPFYTTSVPEHYTITFVTNGGTAVTPQYVLPESKMVVPAVPTKEGELFGGWYANEALTEIFDVEQAITGDITLYAKWVGSDYDADYSIFGNPFATAYVIKTKEQLNALRHIVNGTTDTYSRDILTGKTIKLGNDIVLNDTTDWQYWGKSASATPWMPIGANNYYPFNTTFDGQGYKIIGLYANDNETSSSGTDKYIGLFGYIGADANIKNVGIEASYVEGDIYVGALVGYSEAPITNCFARARVANVPEADNSGRGRIGILVGETHARMTDCYAIGTAEGFNCVGGLAGVTDMSVQDTIRHCYALADVTGLNSVGGLIGSTNNKCVVEECYAKGDVVLSEEFVSAYYPCEKVGGLIGWAAADVNNCYAMGNVYSEGGFTGYIVGGLSATINNCYHIGGLQGKWFDGLGYPWTYACVKNNSYYNKDYPIVAEITTSDTIFGRTTEQMKTYETYAAWNFGEVWGMRATYNEGYPYLQHFLPEELRGQVEAIRLDTRQLPMVQQTTDTLYVTFRPATATCELVWESENPDVVEVNNGVLTAKTVGTAVIKVQDVAGTVSDSCVVTVVATAADIPSITVHFHNTMSWSKVYLYAWSTDGLQTEYLGASPGTEMTPMKDNWYSYTFDPRITDVNFIFSSGDGNQSSELRTNQDVCYRWENWDVKLVDCDTSLPSDVEQVTLSATSLSLNVGDTHTLVATVLPVDAPNKNVTWESALPHIVSVDNAGNLTALAVGSSVITVTTEDGKKQARCFVDVSPAVISVTDVTLSEATLALNVGDTHTLIATVMPENATNTAVTWNSSATDVVSVNDGVLTAHAAGEATITVTTADGGKQASCVVTVTDPSKVTGVELNVHEITLEVGETYQLTAKVFPETAENKDLWWSSDDRTIARVVDGLITARNVGTTKVWVEAGDWENTFTDTCYVTVVEMEEIIPVTSIELDVYSLELTVGETHTIQARILPENATNKDLTWTSTNPEIATVDNKGKVTAVAAGTANINITADGAAIMIQVSVKENESVAIPVTGITLSESNLTLKAGDTHKLVATITPENATNKAVNWMSSNDGVVTVQDGILTAVTEGTATIIATTVDGGKTAMCNVTVEKAEDPVVIPVTGITLSKTNLTLKVGDTHELVATITPENATNKAVNWMSSNDWLVSVQDGFLTAIAEGTATIIATTADGGKTAMCNVTVEKTGENPNPTECENISYSESFSTSLGEFTVVNNLGTNDWYFYSNYGCAYVNGYSSGANDDWLISPAFDLTHKETATIAFTHASAYGSADTKPTHCMVKVSADYVNDVTSATWYIVDGLTFAPGNWTWSNQSLIVPANVLGQPNVVVAFHYNIVSADDAPAWEVKDFVFEAICKESGTHTDMDHVEMEDAPAARKVLEDGVVYILRNGERYMLDGRKVE